MKLFLLVILFSMQSFADVEVIGKKFSDPFGQSHSINKEDEWILFAVDMEGYKMLRESVNDSRVKAIEKKKIKVISDISKMPPLISKMIAIPKMQKLPFKIYLDQEGSQTLHWPRLEGALTLIKLKNGQVMSTEFIEVKRDLISFFKS